MLNAFLTDLSTGWDKTFMKWSVKISAAEAGVMGFLWTCSMFLPIWVMPAAYLLFFAARMAATNLKQGSIASYDPKTQGLYDLATQKIVMINAAGTY